MPKPRFSSNPLAALLRCLTDDISNIRFSSGLGGPAMAWSRHFFSSINDVVRTCCAKTCMGSETNVPTIAKDLLFLLIGDRKN